MSAKHSELKLTKPVYLKRHIKMQLYNLRKYSSLYSKSYYCLKEQFIDYFLNIFLLLLSKILFGYAMYHRN